MNGRRNDTDWALLTEIALVIVLIGLGMTLYWYPAADGFLSPRWWHWLVLAALFFTVVGVGSLRRRTRSRLALRQTIREGAEGGSHGSG